MTAIRDQLLALAQKWRTCQPLNSPISPLHAAGMATGFLACADELTAFADQLQGDGVPLAEFLALMMCSDPWPVADNAGLDAMHAWADRLAQQAGYADWIDAYHALPSPLPYQSKPEPAAEPAQVKEQLNWADWNEIPDSIIKAAREVELYFKRQGVEQWKLCGIESRDHPSTPRDVPAEVGIDLDQFEGHTPGPWEWQTNDACYGELKGAFVDAGEGHIAKVLSHACCADGTSSQQVCEANARLIAAAPQLLAELRRLRAAQPVSASTDEGKT